MTTGHLPDPEILIADDGTPRSKRCDDVYFSVDGGIAETRHVFLGGIDATKIWPSAKRVRVGELGFGTGLNFLVTWHDWIRSAPTDAILSYVAVEGFPIEAGDLRHTLAPLRGELPEIDSFLEAYPIRTPGFHRRVLAGGRVHLTLMFGPVDAMLAEMTGTVDAWYLDGFAPAKNPEMWREGVLADVARRTVPGGHVATFSAAGEVRRNLAAHGFEVTKRPGFGRKRECVSATKSGEYTGPAAGAVAVVGAGLGGACAAHALRSRGISVTLFDASEDLGASGNPAALLAPRLPREQTLMGQVMARSYLYATRFYDALAAQGADIWHGERGAFAMARDDREAERQRRAKAAFAWPDTVMQLVDAETARKLTGAPTARSGAWFPDAGTLNPRGIVSCLRHGIERRTQEVLGLLPIAEGWRLQLGDGSEAVFGTVIVAAGVGSAKLFPEVSLPMRPNRGQIAYVRSTTEGQRAPVTYGGYLSPLVDLDTGEKAQVLGATYARRDELPGDDWEAVRQADTDSMQSALSENMPDLSVTETLGGRTSLRATVRDYLPLVGQLAEGAYILSGLGSRGFLTAPIMAEVIADTIADTPPPLEQRLLAAVHPARFE